LKLFFIAQLTPLVKRKLSTFHFIFRCLFNALSFISLHNFLQNFSRSQKKKKILKKKKKKKKKKNWLRKEKKKRKDAKEEK